MLLERVYNENITFTCRDEMRSIANDFLQAKGLNFYSYCRVYDNNECFILSTHPELSEGFFRQEYYHTIKYDKSVRHIDSSALLWLALGDDDQKLMSYAREYHGLDNGIVLTKRYSDFAEFNYFGAAPQNNLANQYYLAHLDELYNFCFYFKEKGNKLILDAVNNPIFLSDYNPHIELSEEYLYPEIKSIISIEKPMFNGLFYTPELDRSISRREFQCLNGLATGLRAKELASNLNLTERSIRFYIERLKTKTGVYSNSQLIDFYNNLF